MVTVTFVAFSQIGGGYLLWLIQCICVKWPQTFPRYLYLQIHGLINFNCSHAKQPAWGADSNCANNSMSNKPNTIRMIHRAFTVSLIHTFAFNARKLSQMYWPIKRSFCLFGSRFLLQCLEDLDASLRKLNSRLFVIRGQPTDVFPRLFKVDQNSRAEDAVLYFFYIDVTFF